MAQTGGFEITFTVGADQEILNRLPRAVGHRADPGGTKDRSTLVHEGPDVSFALDSEDHVYALRPRGRPGCSTSTRPVP